MLVSCVLRACRACCWFCSIVTGRFWMSIICDTILAVSRPDARPVTWIGALLVELVEIEEGDIATLVIDSRGDRVYGVQTPYSDPGGAPPDRISDQGAGPRHPRG